MNEWRDAQKPLKFLVFDPLPLVLLVLNFFIVTWWMTGLTITAFIISYFLLRKGISTTAALRAVRLSLGEGRNNLPPDRIRRRLDHG